MPAGVAGKGFEGQEDGGLREPFRANINPWDWFQQWLTPKPREVGKG